MYVGRISYSAYLLHYPVLRLYKHLGLASGGLGLLLFVISILAIGQISFMSFESPARSMIRKKSTLQHNAHAFAARIR
jgi:peptidoglycan/LPS O-acetylase OafA/YrhL